MGQKRAERLELPTQKSPAVSAYFGVWVRVWVKPNFESLLEKTKTPQTAVLRGFCGAAIQIRTGDLILTNTLRCVQAVLSGTVWAFFVPIWVVYNGIPPTVPTQFFRVRVRVWVKSQNSKQRHGHKDIEPPSKFAPQNKEKLFFALKTQSKPESPPQPRWTA